MEKQKQIEEMATEIARIILSCPLNQGRHCDVCKFNDKDTISYDCQSYLVAEKLLKKYQPKIPEGAVVLTEEELHDKGYRKVCEPVIRNGEVVGFVNGADYVPKNLFLFGIANTRKETAEKFAERLKKDCVWRNDFDTEGVAHPYTILELEELDEICKEIIGGKDE